VEELEEVWVCYGWRTPPTAHSNQVREFAKFSLMAVGNVVSSGNNTWYMLCPIRRDTIDSVTLTVLSYLPDIHNLIALPPDISKYGSMSLTNSSNTCISLCPSDKLYTHSFLLRRLLEGDIMTLYSIPWVHF
jgi:hypothetical protein